MAKFKKQCTSGDKASRYILLLNVTVGSGNVTTNKTPVSYTLQLAGGNYDGDNYNQYGSSFYGYTCNGSVTVKNKKTGTTLKTSSGSSKGTVSNTSAITIASGSFDAPHNDDGTLTLSFSGTFSGGLSTQATGGSVSGDVPLTTIARASAITATNADIESATTINIDKKSSSFTTTITYAFGNLTGTIVDKTSNTSVGWTVPSTFYAQIPNAKYGTCTLTATTYSGTTKVGSKTTTFKATADEEKCRPTATITAVDSNETTKSLTDGIGNIVVIGKSNVLCAVTRSAKNSATIKSVKVNGTELGTSTTKVTFNNANTNIFEVVVTDSRGYTNEEKIATLGKVDYIDVSIDAKVERNTPTDGKVNITFNGKYFNGSFGKTDNALAVQYIYKEKGTSEYSAPVALTVTLKDNTFSGEASEVEGFDYEKEYVFQVTATDRLSSAPKTAVEIPINKGKPMWWYDQEAFNILTNLLVKDRNILNDIGTLSSLSTTNKGSLVEAINEVKNENNHKGDLITTALSSDFTLSANGYSTLPLTQVIYKKGSSLSVNSSGKIVIGAGISSIGVSGQAYYYTGTTGQKIVQILKNNGVIGRTQLQNVNQYTMIATPRMVLNVSEGDVIDMQFSGTSGDIVKDYNFTTYLSVDVIA